MKKYYVYSERNVAMTFKDKESAEEYGKKIGKRAEEWHVWDYEYSTDGRRYTGEIKSLCQSLKDAIIENLDTIVNKMYLPKLLELYAEENQGRFFLIFESKAFSREDEPIIIKAEIYDVEEDEISDLKKDKFIVKYKSDDDSAALLRSAREDTELSRAEMSRILDIPVRTLEDWEAGRRNPPKWVLKLLLKEYARIKDDLNA